LAFSVALVGSRYHDERGRTDARVVVAGVAPVPANVTVVHQAITTTFDVTLVPRSSTDSPTTFRASRTRRRRTIPLPHDAQFAHALARAPLLSPQCATISTVSVERRALSKGRLVLHVKGTTTEIARAFAAASKPFVDRTVSSARSWRPRHGSVAGRPAHRGVADSLRWCSLREHGSLHVSSRTAIASTCPEDGARPRRRRTPTAATRRFSSPSSTDSRRCGEQRDRHGPDDRRVRTERVRPGDLATYLNATDSTPRSRPSRSTRTDRGLRRRTDPRHRRGRGDGAGAAIEIYQGPNNSSGPIDVYQQIADDDTASIVSTSWGTCESDPVATRRPNSRSSSKWRPRSDRRVGGR